MWPLMPRPWNILHDKGALFLNHSSRVAGLNGTHVETLILGYPSNPQNLIDDPANLTEIKSCRERHLTAGSKTHKPSTRLGNFKINYEQHQYLCSIGGFYFFCIQDTDQGSIINKTLIRASVVESHFRVLERALTKHHYYSLNWKKVFGIGKPISIEEFEKRLFPVTRDTVFRTSDHCYQEQFERGTDPVMDIIFIPTPPPDLAIALTRMTRDKTHFLITSKVVS